MLFLNNEFNDSHTRPIFDWVFWCWWLELCWCCRLDKSQVPRIGQRVKYKVGLGAENWTELKGYVDAENWTEIESSVVNLDWVNSNG